MNQEKNNKEEIKRLAKELFLEIIFDAVSESKKRREENGRGFI